MGKRFVSQTDGGLDMLILLDGKEKGSTRTKTSILRYGTQQSVST